MPSDDIKILDDLIGDLTRRARDCEDVDQLMKINDRLLKAIAMRHRLQQRGGKSKGFDLK